MKIIMLDGQTLADLDWSAMQALGEVEFYQHTSAEQLLERAADAQVLLTNKVVLSREVLMALPKLKYIGVTATGVNVVDLSAASERGIVVTNTPAYGPASVAQMAFAHVLHHASAVAEHHQAVQAGQWVNSTQFCFWNRPLMGLAGKVFGIVGFGAIGQAAARIARGFDMAVLINTRQPLDDLPEGCQWVNQPTLFAQADIVSLHCPQTADNTEFVNADLLASMKPSALLINTARGGLINELDLAEALNNGVIAGAGLDVLSTEPPLPSNPLLTAKNCVITPHNAWGSFEARSNLLAIVCDNLKSWQQGTARNQVNQQ